MILLWSCPRWAAFLLLTARASTGWSHETSSVALGFNLSRFNVGFEHHKIMPGVGGGGVKEEMEKYGDTGQWNKKIIRNRSS
jgi:hypothetical protein